jgi:hypothetical protein
MVSESDWKKFKNIKEKALDKFCGLALDDFRKIINSPGQTNHERYISLYKLVQDYDKRIIQMFDDHSRSKAGIQLVLMKSEGLIDNVDFQHLSPELQEFINKHG